MNSNQSYGNHTESNSKGDTGPGLAFKENCGKIGEVVPVSLFQDGQGTRKLRVWSALENAIRVCLVFMVDKSATCNGKMSRTILSIKENVSTGSFNFPQTW